MERDPPPRHPPPDSWLAVSLGCLVTEAEVSAFRLCCPVSWAVGCPAALPARGRRMRSKARMKVHLERLLDGSVPHPHIMYTGKPGHRQGRGLAHGHTRKSPLCPPPWVDRGGSVVLRCFRGCLRPGGQEGQGKVSALVFAGSRLESPREAMQG